MARLTKPTAASPATPAAPGIDIIGNGAARTQAAASAREPNGPFVLTHHPVHGYAVVGGEILPDLRRKPVDAGSNNATAGSVASALAMFETRGLTVVKPTTAYLVKTPVAGGTHWHTPWERLVAGSAASRPDTDGYHAWLRSLLADGTIPQPGYDALSVLAARVADDPEASEVVKAATDALDQTAALVPVGAAEELV